MVINIHKRLLSCSTSKAGFLIDQLASANDFLWPVECWPAMIFDRPLAVDAAGGHGPIGYTVMTYTPGRSIVFRFTAPAGFHGQHRFDLEAVPGGCQLVHTLEAELSGSAVVSWPLVFRPMHDALIEDSMAKAQVSIGDDPLVIRWTPYVRLLRALVGRGKTRPQTLYETTLGVR